MKLSRRRFFSIIGAGAVMAATRRPAQAETTKDDRPVGCLVDATRCIGCRKCEVACNAANTLPHDDFKDTTVLDIERRPTAEAYTVINRYHGRGYDGNRHLEHIFVKEQCRHCLKPACASACVVGALSKRADGPVVYDQKKCIGCRYCMVACPFQIPAYEDHDPLTPRVRKCTFCYERLDNGKMPACATICPAQAITFGKRDALLEIARKRIDSHPGKYVDHIYGEKEVGGTSWLYLSPVKFDFFPKLGDTPPPRLTEMILSGVFGYAAAPIALFTVLGGIAWYNQKKDADKNDEHNDKNQGGQS